MTTGIDENISMTYTRLFLKAEKLNSDGTV